MKKLLALAFLVFVVGPLWGGSVNVTDLEPGTDAEDLGKQKGAAAGASDVGVAVYGERKDTPAELAEADGQYTTPKYDSTGKQWVHCGELIALTASFTPMATPDYTASDAAGGLLEFANAVVVAGGSLKIHAAVISDTEGLQATSDFMLILLNQTFTATTDNDPITFSDSEIDQIRAAVSFDDDANDDATNAGFATNGIMYVRDINQVVVLEAATTSLFGQCRINGASNYASGQNVTITLLVERL